MIDPAQLITDYFNQTLDAEGEAQLRAYILENPGNAQAFMQAAMLHNNLRDYFQAALANSAQQSPSLSDAQILPALTEQPEDPPIPSAEPFKFILLPRPLSTSKPPSPKSRWKLPVAFSAVAASLAIIITLSLWYRWLNTPAATLTRTVNAQWSAAPLADGEPVDRHLLQLTAGFAEFAFPNHAVVVIQAPAIFRLQSPTTLRLYSGRLTTNIPQEAIGFTVNIPSAAIIDLGTEVGIDVSPDAHSHVEVFKGKVGIRLDQTPLSSPLDRVMTLATAVNIDAQSQKIADAPLEPLVFTRVDQLDHPASTPSPVSVLAPAPVLADSFARRLLADPDLLAYYAFDAHDQSAGLLTNHALATAGQFDGQLQHTSWTNGPTEGSSALRFDGKDSRVLINIPTPARALTITAWINLAHFDRPYAAILLSDGNRRSTACHFQCTNIAGRPSILFSNPAPDKPIPYNNYHFHSSDIATNLNTWRFVAVVYDLAAGKVTCWLDGKPLDTPHSIMDPTPLIIGSAQIGNWNAGDGPNSRALDGSISQLAVWKRPLKPSEIIAMYQTGTAGPNKP